MSLPPVTAVSVAHVLPGDVVVLECDLHLSKDVCDRFTDHLQPLWPDNKIVVLTGGMKLKIARPEDVPAVQP